MTKFDNIICCSNQNTNFALAAWSSGIATDEIGTMGREIESHQGIRW
jgi:hypothetical protein